MLVYIVGGAFALYLVLVVGHAIYIYFWKGKKK